MAKCSILVPTLNEEKYIDGLLSDIEKQSIKPFETIIIDAGSNDLTLDVVKRYDCKIINSHPPVGYQRDQAGRAATGDVLIFLDADVRIKANFIERSIKQFEKRELDIACPLYWPSEGNLLVKVYNFFLNLVFITIQKLHPSGGGACIIVKKRLFEEKNGFDESYVFDDLEFIYRAGKNNNFGMIYTPITISDRRFRKYGTLATIKKQVKIAYQHMRGELTRTNDIEYEFGKFEGAKDQADQPSALPS